MLPTKKTFYFTEFILPACQPPSFSGSAMPIRFTFAVSQAHGSTTSPFHAIRQTAPIGFRCSH